VSLPPRLSQHGTPPTFVLHEATASEGLYCLYLELMPGYNALQKAYIVLSYTVPSTLVCSLFASLFFASSLFHSCISSYFPFTSLFLSSLSFPFCSHIFTPFLLLSFSFSVVILSYLRSPFLFHPLSFVVFPLSSSLVCTAIPFLSRLFFFLSFSLANLTRRATEMSSTGKRLLHFPYPQYDSIYV